MKEMDKTIINFETDNMFVRAIEEKDKEPYMDLRVSASEIAAAYIEFPGFRDKEWEGELNNADDIYCAVFLKKNNEFAACCSFQKFNTDMIELGFYVKQEYRNQGIATELLKGMLRTAADVFPGKSVKACTYKTNTASRKVIEKCGGRLSGYESSPAAKALESLLESIEKKTPDVNEAETMRSATAEYIEDHKESVCVYRFS